jgi:hypothetical protein
MSPRHAGLVSRAPRFAYAAQAEVVRHSRVLALVQREARRARLRLVVATFSLSSHVYGSRSNPTLSRLRSESFAPAAINALAAVVYFYEG